MPQQHEIMPDLVRIRTSWEFLKTVHPLFLFATPFVTNPNWGLHRYGEGSKEYIDNLMSKTKLLRIELKLNTIKQRVVDIDELIEDGLRLGELELDMIAFLEELESLVDAQVVEGKTIKVR